MKINLFALILVGLSLPGTTQAKSDTCLGKEVFHNVLKGESLWKITKTADPHKSPAEILQTVYKLAETNEITDPNMIHVGQKILLDCEPEVIVPEIPEVATSEPAKPVEPSLPLPEITPRVEEVQEVLVEVPKELPTELALADIPTDIPQETPEKIPEEKREVPASQKTHKAYLVVLRVPEGAVQGIAEGHFPAELLEDQTAEGRWKKRTDMSVRSQKLGTIYNVFIILEKKPGADALVAIDFQNGYGFPVRSEHLANGAEMMVEEIPRKFESKDYKSLRANFPGRSPLIIRAFLRPMIQVGPPVAFALFTGNPFAIASVASNIIRGRLEAKNERSEVEMLRQEIEVLRTEIASFQQTRYSQIAQEVRR